MNRAPCRSRRRQAGFSLIELVISMVIAIEILIAAAIAFDVHNKIANVQIQITDLQQSMRVAQYDILRTVRTAGRGGLPFGLDPDADFQPAATIPALSGIAIEVRNNVAGDARRIARGNGASPQAIAGSDILTVRGCISGTAYQVNPAEFNWDADDNGVADDNAVLTIPRTSIASIVQPLGPLADELAAAGEDPAIFGRLALVSPTALQDYAVADIVDYEVNGDAADPDSIDLTLDLNNNSPLNPVNVDDPSYDPLTPEASRMYPTNMTISIACFLEEYRYYVREVAGDALTPLRPRLTRARFEPGTELPYLGEAQSFTLDLADGIFDLQIAFGLDTDFSSAGLVDPGSFDDDIDWEGPDDTIYEASPFVDGQDRTQDDWLYNDPDDNPAAPQYTLHGFGTNTGVPVQVYYVRVSVAGRTVRLDRTYQAPPLDIRTDGDWIEDHDLDADPGIAYNSGDGLKHRRRVLQAIVDMRNI